MKCQKCGKKLVVDYRANILYGRIANKRYTSFRKYDAGVNIYECLGCHQRLAVKSVIKEEVYDGRFSM